jgi:hypothetical protein
MLASRREDLNLWDAYARLELQRGNVSSARAVYAAVLAPTTGVRGSEPPSDDILRIWASWAELEWIENNTIACLNILLAAVDPLVDMGKFRK